MGIQHAVCHDHVSSVIEVFTVRKITKIPLLQYLSNKYTHPDAPPQFGQPKTNTLAGKAGYGVVGEAEWLIVWGRCGLYGESACNSDSLAPVDWRVNDEELEFEYSLDILVDLFGGLYFTCMMRVFARTLAFTEKWRQFAAVSDADIFGKSMAEALDSLKHCFEIF